MIQWKKHLRKLLLPPIWAMAVLTVISTVSLVFVFVKGLDTHPVSYAVYMLSFYTLCVVTAYCVTVLPKRYSAIRQKAYNNKYANRYLTDPVYRTRISLYISLSINLLYISTNVLSGFLYHTAWFFILAGYYGILAAMRFLLVRYVNKNQIGTDMCGEWKRSRTCASILTLINLSLAASVPMMMYQNKGAVYHGILIYAMAAYTFYITTIAIINIVKYRRYNSPIMSTTKVINLAAALVSMLSLETAMLTAFGTDASPETKKIFIAATGAGICVIVLALSGYMIVLSTKEIRNMEKE